MKIQYASDLHLEFKDNARYLRDNPLLIAGDILVLAGDIGYLGDDNYKNHPFWDQVSENYKQVLVVPGNHEFYKGYGLESLSEGHVEGIRENVSWYYNQTVTINSIDFILTPLWSSILPQYHYWTEQAISDFRKIYADGQLLTAFRFNAEHEACLRFLKEALKTESDNKRIVITHHLPTFICMAEEYKNSVLNGAFVSEQYDLIHDNNIDYWIYGHSHRNMPPATINRTTLLCNQLGYVHHNEHLSFKHDAAISML
ncbi:metallophosphoesterase [uncultured Bacteroides sp.]|uniref:metallophosphoesterase n=1 Tax=uncultured Bacteroides sp. TaxID=162156 RepID=UPI002AA6D032|nr:metallophosphoesterase [uncultured Bacteroides sp.]